VAAESNNDQSKGRPDHADPTVSVPKPDVTGVASPNAAHAVEAVRLDRQQRRNATVLRLLLLAMASGGTIAAIWLWAVGHPNMGWRLLAGDVLAIVLLLLAF